jgi:hypothetical protein
MLWAAPWLSMPKCWIKPRFKAQCSTETAESPTPAYCCAVLMAWEQLQPTKDDAGQDPDSFDKNFRSLTDNRLGSEAPSMDTGLKTGGIQICWVLNFTSIALSYKDSCAYFSVLSTYHWAVFLHTVPAKHGKGELEIVPCLPHYCKSRGLGARDKVGHVWSFSAWTQWILS